MGVHQRYAAPCPLAFFTPFLPSRARLASASPFSQVSPVQLSKEGPGQPPQPSPGPAKRDAWGEAAFLQPRPFPPVGCAPAARWHEGSTRRHPPLHSLRFYHRFFFIASSFHFHCFFPHASLSHNFYSQFVRAISHPKLTFGRPFDFASR
jgi:hypothetical protein